MSHCDAMRVTQAFKRDENSGKGLENIAAKLDGNQEGNSDLKTLLHVDGRAQPRYIERREQGSLKRST